jgi:VWFA-related protein
VRGRTALYDGIVDALDHLKAAALDRKVLITISDGGDNASRYKLADVLKLAEQSSATIYTIGIYDDDDPDRNPRVLRSLAHATGGLSFISADTGELATFCTRIAHDIRNQYTLGYVPSKPARPGEYRAVRVVAKSPRLGKLTVRARAGYRIATLP